MNSQQEHNCLNWAAAMLSGQYKHGKVLLYNSALDTHSALGVVLRLAGHPTVHANQFADVYPVSRNRFISSVWFDRLFGLKYPPGHYQTMNDATNNYYATAVLVLSACPDSERKKQLYTDLLEQFNARVKEGASN